MSKKNRSHLSNAQARDVGMDPTVAAARHQLSPHQWNQLVARAHKRGVTVAGLLSGAPAALQERTRASLRAQATNTVAASYAPAQQDLTDQEARLKTIDEKRHNDNTSYLQWLQGQSDRLLADSRAADKTVADRQQAILDTTTAGYKALHDEAASHVAAQQPGMVSNPNQSSALDFTAAGQQAIGTQANLIGKGLADVKTNDNALAATAANNFAVMAAAEAKRAADTWQGLTSVADDRHKLVLQQGADTAKEVARLLDNEVTKAQNNRDYAAAAAKLGIDQSKMAETKREFDKTFGLNKAKFNLDVKKWAHQVRVDHATLGIKRDTLNQSADQFNRSQQLAWYKAKHPNARGGKDAAGHDLKSTNQYAFDTAYAAITTGTRTAGKGKKAKTHGYDYGYVSKNRNFVIAQLISLGFNRRTASLAVTAYLARAGNGSDPGDIHDYVGGPPHYGPNGPPTH